jgi:alkylhydroperoxidase family enzyme
VLRLAAAVVRGRGRVGDDLVSDVRAAGVTDEEIAETVGHVALNVLTNLFNNFAATDNDWPTVQPRTRAA